MSINIDEIYCNHFLVSEDLKSFCKNMAEYDSFFFTKDNVLTSFHIKDSIHYNSLINSNYELYEKYLIESNQKDHSKTLFLDLLNNFDIKKMKKIKINYLYEKNKYFIEDGCHRLSILLFKKYITDKVPIEYLDIGNNCCFYYVIYDHGIDKLNSICEEIQKQNIRIDKKILMDLPKQFFPQFIFGLYKDEQQQHIISKNRYILEQNKNKVSVKVSILQVSVPIAHYMKVGNSQKCTQIELTKRHIRNLYNPKFSNLEQQIDPLNKGVSHHHIIHSTDFPCEFMSFYNIIDTYSRFTVIDLLLFFKDMTNYTIIKKDKNFPMFNVSRDDIDILCLDMKKTVEHLENVLQNNYSKYKSHFDSKNEQLNIYYGNISYANFIVKFDLFDDICKMYPSYKISSDVTKEVIQNSIIENDISVPLLKDELMIRRLEYETYIHKRPDKIKHLKYINYYPEEKYTVFSKIL